MNTLHPIPSASVFSTFKNQLSLFLLGSLLLLCNGLKAQDAYTGKDFWTGFMSNNGSAGTMQLHLSAATLTTATISIPNATPAWSTTVTINANTISTVDIPASTGGVTMGTCAANAVTKTGIHIVANNPVSVYGSSSGVVGSAGAYIAIPTMSLGNEYLTLCPDGTAQFMAIATQNNTTITIKLPAGKPATGRAAGATWTVNLNQGETYRMETTLTGLIGDLTGTEITASAPIAVLSGSAGAAFPGDGNKAGYANCGPLDHIIEFLSPAPTWGKKYVAIDFKNPANVAQSQTKSSYLRVVTVDPGVTTFTITGYPTQTLSGRGNYMDYEITGGTVVLSDKQVAVFGVTSGNVCYFPLPTGGQGDASFVTLVPEEQWGKSSPFVCLPTFTSAINVLAKSANPNIVIDGTTYNGFVQIGTSGFYTKTIAMPAGSHLATSVNDNFLVYVYGFSLAVAYSYSAAGPTLIRLDKTVKAGYTVDTVCVGTPTTFADTSLFKGTMQGSTSWDFGDGSPLDANKNTTHTYAAAGNYTVKLVVRDTAGSADSTSKIVVVKALPTITFGSVSPICVGDSIQLSTSGGDTYAWSPSTGLSRTNIANPKASPPSNQTYTVRVTNSTTKCFRDGTVSVTLHPVPNAVITGNLSVCPGGNSTTLSASGGVSYVWLPGNQTTTSITVNPTVQTTYSLIATDANGCKDTSTAVVTMSPPPSSAQILINPRSCTSPNGSIVISSVGGGVAPYEYSRNGITFQSSNTFSGLDAQDYTFTIRDSKGCSFDTTITVGVTEAPNEISFTTTPSGCGTPIGNITVSGAIGGLAPYQYSTDGITYQSGTTFSPLGSGSYQLFVKDANGCIYDTIALIGSTSGPNAISEVVTADSCGKRNGEITINTIIGGSSPYQISLDGGPMGSATKFTGLTGGSHTITILDAAGCQYSKGITVPTIAPITSFTVSAVAESCELTNGRLSAIDIIGGTAPFSYRLGSGTYQPANTFNGLDSGTFTVEVRDKNLCVLQMPGIVAYLPPITALNDVTTAATCTTPNGQVVVSAVGGSAPYTYSIDGGLFGTPNTFTGLTIGQHSVEARDTNQCSATKTITIVDTPGPSAATTIINPTSCTSPTGVIDITAVSGGTQPYTYSLDGSAFTSTTTYNGLASGPHTFTIKDANNCQFSNSVTVPMVNSPTAFSNTVTHPVCTQPNGVINITGVTGGTAPYTYSMDGGPFTATTSYTALNQGQHVVTVRDANSCQFTDFVILTDRPGPTDMAITVVPTSCGRSLGSATFGAVTSGTAPFDYSTDGAPFTTTTSYTNLPGGTYSVVVRDANQCTTTKSYTISDILGPFGLLTKHQDDTCNKGTGKIIIDVVNGPATPFEYSLDSITFQTSTTFNGVPAGNYRVFVRDANGCFTTGRDTVRSIAGPGPATIRYNHPHCGLPDGAILVLKSTIVGGQAPYSLTVGTVTNPPSSRFTGLSSGTDTLIITDKVGCAYKQGFTLTDISGPQSAVPVPVASVCNEANGSVSITQVTGGTLPYTYSDDDATYSSNNTFTQLLSGTYTFYVKDSAGCELPVPVTITGTPGPTDITVDIYDENCDRRDGQLRNLQTVGGTAPFSFSVNSGVAVNEGDTVKNLKAGEYIVDVTDGNGCKFSKTYNLLLNPAPEAIFSANPDKGETPHPVSFDNNSTGGTNYFWDFGDYVDGDTSSLFSPSYVYQDTGAFKVKLIVSNDANCVDSTEKIVRVKAAINVFFGSSFTPNGDGINDRFEIKTNNVLSFTAMVFNRWGQKVAELTQDEPNWDGFFERELCKPDMYVVHITAVDVYGKAQLIIGKLSLIR